MDKILNIINEIVDNTIISITISNKKYSEYNYDKVTVVQLEDLYQITKYTSTQAFHSNVEKKELVDLLLPIVNNYKQIDGKTEKGNYNIRINKRNNVLRRFTEVNNKSISKSHNRKKNYIIQDYENMQILKDLDIVTQDNNIAAPMRDKFRQINKYVELVDDLISQDKIEKLKIIDFGSGKSYLTFVLYHYLTYTKKIDTEIVGVDLKEAVIKDNIDLAK